MDARNSGIYQIVNSTNGKRYIGSAVDFDKRWIGHLGHLRRGTHHSRHLQSAWRKHGASAFSFQRLLICERSDLVFFEQRAIDAFAPEYNVAKIAGSTLGVPCSPEKAAKISKAKIGKPRSRASVEASAAKRRGVKLTPERVAKMLGNKHALGLKHTDEWKAANSARNMGKKRPKSPEYRAKIAATLRGRKLTPEHRAAVSAAMLGKKRGPYVLKKRAES